MSEEKVLNIYGDPATHYDCLDYDHGDCDGEMVWWENPRTFKTMMRCAHHAEIADRRHDKIQREYLNDTVRGEV